MAVGRRRADPGPARRIGKGEAGRSLLGDQIERGADQRLAQIAVVIAAPPVAIVALPRPAHVRDFYIKRPARYTSVRLTKNPNAPLLSRCPEHPNANNECQPLSR